jgi:hypothetical protein
LPLTFRLWMCSAGQTLPSTSTSGRYASINWQDLTMLRQPLTRRCLIRHIRKPGRKHLHSCLYTHKN